MALAGFAVYPIVTSLAVRCAGDTPTLTSALHLPQVRASPALFARRASRRLTITLAGEPGGGDVDTVDEEIGEMDTGGSPA